MNFSFIASEEHAQQLDKQDPVKAARNLFHFPQHNGKDAIYFCGNSLGLQPKKVKELIDQELSDWQQLAVEGYFHAKNPWLVYQHQFKSSLAPIMGAKENEVTVMNTLTVNLHLMMLSFYQPNSGRYKIMMEAGAFPSDQYAVETQVKFYGFDPDDAIIEIHPREGEKTLRTEDILQAIENNKNELALTLFGGINYYTGQLYDMQAITAKAHDVGAMAGWDLAHVAGNVPVKLHDWNVDFAVWCSYKYLNSGPGAVGGVFIHEKHANNKAYRRMAGWWGNDEKTRFKMEKGFIPDEGAGGWHLSTAQVFNMVALKASMEIFDTYPIHQLREKSIKLTAWLAFLLKQLTNLPFEIITPENPEERGAQLSLYFKSNGKQIQERMKESGIICDYREPGVIRLAPAPLYCSFSDVYRFFEILKTFDV